MESGPDRFGHLHLLIRPVKYSMLKMLWVGGRRPRQGPVQKPILSDSASADEMACLTNGCCRSAVEDPDVGLCRVRYAACAEASNVGAKATDLRDDLARTFQT
jgi:hypothetical protein